MVKRIFVSIKKRILFLLKSRVFYAVLAALSSLLLLADVAVAAFVPTGISGSQKGGMDMELSDMGDMDFSDMGDMPDMDSMGDMPDSMGGMDSFPGGADFDADTESAGGFMGEGGQMGGFPGGGTFDPDSADSDNISDLGGTEDSDSGFSVLRALQAVKSHWLIILIVAGVVDIFGIIMLVILTKKKQKRELQSLKEKMEADGEIHLIRSPKKTGKTSYAALALPLVGLLLLVSIVRAMSLHTSVSASTTEATVYSGNVELGSISTVLPGAGTLEEETAEALSLPEGVEIAEWYVSNGDTVAVGDTLARVDKTSVLTAIASIQDLLEALDAELAEHEDDEVSETLAATAGGRVKVIYAAEDVSVLDTMYENGALLLLSLDGSMAVSIETDAELSAGDSVVVTLSDGAEETGKVESAIGGAATITLTDDGTVCGDSVTVTDEDGNELGSGELYIHSELKVTGFLGTISSVEVSEEEEVSAGDALLTLTDTGYSGEYELLAAQRSELTAELQTLFRLYEEEYIYAEYAGVISGLSVSSDTSDSDTDDSDTDSPDTDSSEADAGQTSAVERSSGAAASTVSYANVSGGAVSLSASDGVEENSGMTTVFTNYIAIVSGVSEDSISIRLFPTEYTIENYGDLSWVESVTSKITVDAALVISDTAELYLYGDGALTSASAGDIAEGDVLVLVFDSEIDLSDTSELLTIAPPYLICLPQSGSEGTGSTGETSGGSSGSAGETSGGSAGSGEGSGFGSDNSSDNSSDSFGSADSDAGSDGVGETSGFGSDGSAASDNADGSFGMDSSGSDSTGLSDSLGSGSFAASDSAGADESFAESLADEETEALAEQIAQTYSVSETTWLSITPQDQMTITITVDEMDILSLSVGLEAAVTLDAFPGQSFEGVVTSIDRTGTNSGGSSKYTAVVAIDRTGDMLAGMNASVKITLDVTSDVPVIPVNALVEDETGVYVYTEYNEETETFGGLTEVTTGVSDGESVEILSGLSEGSEYWYSCLDTVNYSSSYISSGNGFSFGSMFGGGGGGQMR